MANSTGTRGTKMKKVLLTISFLLITVMAFAGTAIQKPINETLPSSVSSAVLIKIPDTSSVSDYAVQARGDVDIHISDVSALTTYWTIKSGSVISLSQLLGNGATLFYARSSGDADTIELLLIKN